MQQTGVFHDHLVLLHHVQEGVHQLGVLNGDDLVHVLLDIREHQIAGSLYRHAVGDGGDVVQRDHMARFHTGLHGGRAGGLHADDLHIGVEQLGQGGLTPAARPPPPMGTRMTSTSGRSLEDLIGDGALAGGHGQIVERRDVGHALAPRPVRMALVGSVVKRRRRGG